MRAFHMNLLVYAVNANFPAMGVATAKQTNLRNEMAAHIAARPGAINVAGFTEAHLPDGFNQANVVRALNDFGAALNIPAGIGRHLAVIRCGRSALQDNNEVIAIVLDGNAVVNNYGIKWFTIYMGHLNWQNLNIPAAALRFTSYLHIPNGAVPDYRYIVYVDFTLAAVRYVIGFIHNRAPGNVQTMLVMQGVRDQVLDANIAHPDNLTLVGGDFNAPAPLPLPPPLVPPTRGFRDGGPYHGRWYYSPGNTTVANRYDYWISRTEFHETGVLPPATAISYSTPHPPNAGNHHPLLPPPVTGSDHRGVEIDFQY